MEDGMLQSRVAKERFGYEVEGKVEVQESIMVLEMSYAVMCEAPRECRRDVVVPVPQARSTTISIKNVGRRWIPGSSERGRRTETAFPVDTS
jgi:hypothetical protein